jgi:F-type H+-transporting ATPase subunit delta
VSNSASLTSGISGRYATALFELAKEMKVLPKVEEDLNDLESALKESADFRDLLSSPIYSRADQDAAVSTVAKKMGLSDVVTNTLRLMASKRRLFVVPQLIASVKALIADDRGEVTAEVRSARALTDEQSKALAETLKKSVGKDVKIKATVDESLIGGLVVKLGSLMIDSSIRAKLSKLQNMMKEVG